MRKILNQTVILNYILIIWPQKYVAYITVLSYKTQRQRYLKTVCIIKKYRESLDYK